MQDRDFSQQDRYDFRIRGSQLQVFNANTGHWQTILRGENVNDVSARFVQGWRGIEWNEDCVSGSFAAFS